MLLKKVWFLVRCCPFSYRVPHVPGIQTIKITPDAWKVNPKMKKSLEKRFRMNHLPNAVAPPGNNAMPPMLQTIPEKIAPGVDIFPNPP